MSNTKLNKNQAGDGIYTSDNLVAGSGISIQQVPQPVIDENTLGVWHFDGNKKNAISGSSVAINASDSDTYYSSSSKFGTACYRHAYGKSDNQLFSNNVSLAGVNSTLDLWVKTATNNSDGLWFCPKYGKYFLCFRIYIYGTVIYIYNVSLNDGSDQSVAYAASTINSSWYHLAIENYGTNLNVYIDGTLVAQGEMPTGYSVETYVISGANSSSSPCIDEIRLSNVARYKGQNFTPFDKPYAAAGGPAQYAINNTKADPDLSSYLQNTATGTNALTINGVATTGAQCINIGDNSQAVGGQSVAVGSGTTTSNSAYANTNCVAIGFAARASYSSGIAIGRETETTGNNGVAVGYESVATTNAVAIGKTAKATAQSAIQLGTGTNSTANTFQVFGTTVVDANGKVPLATLPIVQLTQAEYDALDTKDANIIYAILPETSSEE